MWVEIAENYNKNKKDKWYKIPNNVVGTLVNPISGTPAENNDKNATVFYYIKGTEPNYENKTLEDLIPTVKQEKETTQG